MGRNQIMNNASESQNEKLSPTIQITNQIPKNQSLQIQNIDPNHPIQLKVDPITDYFALSVTITVSILTAIISAYVTIKIVTKSNEKLIESQELLQNNALKHNKEKELSVLTSKNRQDWINTLRTDISEIISKSTNIIHNLRATLQVNHTQNNLTEDFSIFISSYQQVSSIIVKVELFLNLEKTPQKNLQDTLNQLKDDLMLFCNANLTPFPRF